jgi:SAM-dependent methyltransferase
MSGNPAIRCLRHSAEAALSTVVKSLTPGAAVLDIGCQGWRPYRLACTLGRADLRHAGCDCQEEASPPGAEFRMADLRSQALPWPDDSFDCVVLSHVLEHLHDPNAAFGEAVRVCRPGGIVFVEMPSDRSTLFSLPWAQHLHLLLSYWDDPTHVGRPFTPQALYRMAVYWSCSTLVARYDQRLSDLLLFPLRLLAALWRHNPDALVTAWWRAIGWSCYAILRKDPGITGKPAMRYFSFKGIRAGDLAAGRPPR